MNINGINEHCLISTASLVTYYATQTGYRNAALVSNWSQQSSRGGTACSTLNSYGNGNCQPMCQSATARSLKTRKEPFSSFMANCTR